MLTDYDYVNIWTSRNTFQCGRVSFNAVTVRFRRIFLTARCVHGFTKYRHRRRVFSSGDFERGQNTRINTLTPLEIMGFGLYL
jgi:hypothetical protein